MKAKLIKKKTGIYKLESNGEVIASSDIDMNNDLQITKLSIKNCQAIERGYDLDELAESYANYMNDEDGTTDIDFKVGFQKALELMGDKKFSEGDLRRAYSRGKDLTSEDRFKFAEWEIFTKLVDSLQQTEWDVDIEMDILNEYDKPQLDADGCLILKRL